jgi:anaerobic ribonucleoside-triphosphate reductase
LKENIQVKRLNLIIMNQPSEVMTVQTIVDIYGKLFDRITPLFDGIMYDHWSSEQFMNPEMEEVYATINVAILEIVNNLPEDIMYHLLRNFHETYQMLNTNKKVRFNIYSFCKEDYPRLDYTLEMLRREGVVLPMS